MTAVKRHYDSPRRRTQALATRQRLAASARRLFAAHGYAATTIESIARDAGQAVQTFYATFGSKRAVLMALLEAMDEAADIPSLMQALASAPDDRPRQLEAVVGFNMRLFGQSIDLLEIFRSAGEADPDIAAVGREGEERRRAGQAPIVHGWAEAGALRDGLDESTAAQILWSLTSPDLFSLFVVRQHWAVARYGRWLHESLQQLLFS